MNQERPSLTTANIVDEKKRPSGSSNYSKLRYDGPPPPQKTPRIGFGYQARVGKDTAVDHLLKLHGGIRLSFAAPLYDIMYYAQDICNFPRQKDRGFLQYIGTEWARHQDPEVWVNIVRRKILAESPTTPIFISDVRFPNEINMLKSLGFTLVNVTRDENVRLDAFAAAPTSSSVGSTAHASETALASFADVWDRKIENNGTFREFFAKIEELTTGCPRLFGSPRPQVGFEELADFLLEESPRDCQEKYKWAEDQGQSMKDPFA